MIIEERLSANGKKIYYRFIWGRGSSDKMSAGIFTYAKPKSQIEKNHNKESLTILELKRSQLVLDRQSIGTGYIPAHRYKQNFLEFFEEFTKKNVRKGKRHLQCSFNHFKTFIGKKQLAPIEVTEELCQRYRNYLLGKFNGDTPMNYFSEFKRMIRAATKQGYFRINPVDEIKAKAGKKRKLKQHLEVEEYLKLLRTPCLNEEVREGYIVCCYTALRWVDIKLLDWSDIGADTIKTQLIQAKTGEPVVLTMHPVAKAILDKRKARFQGEKPTGKVFKLPAADGANKILTAWVNIAGIDKYITWSSARLSFSILLQDERVDSATVALLLGHTSTRYVEITYKRHRPKDQEAVIAKLPSPEKMEPPPEVIFK
ncbi:site-specific integrase [Agriterribacter sp.]|uniref:site-specific integrase n=1 Tax=Agriterribacter sp. TaxID=2821509 RepID=UPI002CEC655D|nr:site-specific integrase [Agriterribacter sp.]HTN05149.1 site-specific integrase [Agriterribacter sp.]